MGPHHFWFPLLSLTFVTSWHSTQSGWEVIREIKVFPGAPLHPWLPWNTLGLSCLSGRDEYRGLPQAAHQALAYHVPGTFIWRRHFLLVEPGEFLQTLYPYFNVCMIHLGFCYKVDLDLIELGRV